MTVKTRERIKQAALTLFLEQGFSKTSIGAIEKAAGLAPRAGAFYRHYESKGALLGEIMRSQVSETPEGFDFDGLKSLGDTRAELVVIAQNYEKAVARQAPFARLIEEIRLLEGGREAENDVNAQMLHALMEWAAAKPRGRGLARQRLAALVMNIFGAWLFYLGKVQGGVTLDDVDRDVLLDEWATFWAKTLDGDG